MESGGGSRRRRSHSAEKFDSVKDDDGLNSHSGLTLSAVLGADERPSPAQVNRTLLDIIRDDPTYGKESKKTWKAFKDKLRLRRAGSAWISTIPVPASDVPIQNTNRMMRRHSTRFPTNVVNMGDQTSESTHPELSSSTSTNGEENHSQLNTMPSNRAMMLRHNSSRMPSLSASGYGRGVDGLTSSNTREKFSAENEELHRRVRYMEDDDEDEDDEEEEAEEGEGDNDESAEGGEEGGVPPVRMSLMALLAETDREMGLDESTYVMDDEEEEEEEEEEEQEGGGVDEYNNCCVCMVRHKGSAFIPCGHTFCRLCSRELFVQRGNCPLCNGFILEILDIF